MNVPAGAAGGDDAAVLLRRLKMRAWRRGTREMDLILGPFADEVLPSLNAPERTAFESLLDENDHDLYQWIAARLPSPHAARDGDEEGRMTGPEALHALLGRIAAHAATRLRA